MPAAHSAQLLPPVVGWAQPAGHAEHVEALAPLKRPAAQAVPAVAPRGQYDPAGHSTQDSSPVRLWYWPFGHDTHVLWPVNLLYWPAAQSEQALARSLE